MWMSSKLLNLNSVKLNILRNNILQVTNDIVHLNIETLVIVIMYMYAFKFWFDIPRNSQPEKDGYVYNYGKCNDIKMQCLFNHRAITVSVMPPELCKYLQFFVPKYPVQMK